MHTLTVSRSNYMTEHRQKHVTTVNRNTFAEDTTVSARGPVSGMATFKIQPAKSHDYDRPNTNVAIYIPHLVVRQLVLQLRHSQHGRSLHQFTG